MTTEANSENPKSKIQNPKSDVPAHIFREYDIRGVVDKDLSENVYYNLGRAYATFLYAQDGA
jgi:phosphomannomutase/phosphoglucomutase